MKKYICVDPRLQTISQLEACAEALDRANHDETEFVQVIRACHLALYSALVAALIGPAGIGAFSPSLKGKHLEQLSSSSQSDGKPLSEKIQIMDDLIKVAKADGLVQHFGGNPLHLEDTEDRLLERLQAARHAIEHPKPGIHSLEIAWLLEPLPVASSVSLWLLEHPSIRHHTNEEEAIRAQSAVSKIKRLSVELLRRLRD